MEAYYQKTNKEEFESFINQRRKELISDAEMMAIENALVLYKLGNPLGAERLLEYGISGDLENGVKQRRTKYNFKTKERNQKAKAKTNSDYYEMITFASKTLGYHVPFDILLPEWCGTLNILKKIKPDGKNT